MADEITMEPGKPPLKRRWHEVRAGEYAPEMVQVDNAGNIIGSGGAGSSSVNQSDYDTGVGEDLEGRVGIIVPAAGGAVEIQGDVANGLDVDVTRVQGNVNVVQGAGEVFEVDSELPAAAALADAAANPSTPTVGAGALLWNGTGWDRVRGDIANGVDVDVTRVQGNVNVVQPAGETFEVQGIAGGTAVPADTELPAAAALADGAANPTVPNVGANSLLYNGVTWDRMRGDTANGLDVDVTRLPVVNQRPDAAASRLLTVQSADPVAGANWSFTVPAGKWWVPQGIVATFVTSATTGDRRAVTHIDDNTGKTFFDIANGHVQAANLTYTYSWMFAGYTFVSGIYAGHAQMALPKMILGPGYVINQVVDNLKVDDNWGVATINVLEFDYLPSLGAL